MIKVISDQCNYYPDFIGISEAYRYFELLWHKTKWQQDTVYLFNKQYYSPRLTAWYGDEQAVYRYSGNTHIPLPWYKELVELKNKIELFCHREFNSVLLNYYAHGQHGMGKHSDDESALGHLPFIASLSLGGERQFVFHSRISKQVKPIRVSLLNGSLLVMYNQCQEHWKHSVPKTRRAVQPRINLTFRTIE